VKPGKNSTVYGHTATQSLQRIPVGKKSNLPVQRTTWPAIAPEFLSKLQIGKKENNTGWAHTYLLSFLFLALVVSTRLTLGLGVPTSPYIQPDVKCDATQKAVSSGSPWKKIDLNQWISD